MAVFTGPAHMIFCFVICIMEMYMLEPSLYLVFTKRLQSFIFSGCFSFVVTMEAYLMYMCSCLNRMFLAISVNTFNLLCFQSWEICQEIYLVDIVN